MSRLFFLLSIVLFAAALPMRAHHSVLPFDGSRAVVVSGIVGDVVWGNPHVYIAVHADGSSSRGRWVIEIESPAVLSRIGWRRDSIRAGDRVRSVGAPAKDGSRMMRCQSVALPSGAELPCYPR